MIRPPIRRGSVPVAKHREAAAVSPPLVNWVRDDRYSWFLAALLWLMLPYMIIPGDIFSVAKYGAEQMATGNSLSRALKLSWLGVGVLFGLWRLGLTRRLLWSTNIFFLAFLTIVPLSALWSINAGATIARYISILSITGAAIAFVLAGWHTLRFQNVLRPIITTILFASLVFGMLEPTMAIEIGEGTLKNSWHGLTGQKNQFGLLASFGLVFWLHAWLSAQSKLLPVLFGISVSSACLLLSRSSTSLLSSVFVLVFMLMALRMPRNLRRYTPYIVTVFALLVIIYAVAVLKLVPGLDVLLTPITSFTGKDLTFSNRSEIWVIIKEHIDLNPYIGSGYGAYWVGAIPSSPSYVFLSRMFFYPSESHNGYLESINDLGFLGLIILLGYLFVYVRDSLQLMRIDRSQGVLFLGLFFQQAIINLSESCWLQVNSPAFIIMTIATFALARGKLEHGFRASSCQS